MRIVEKEETLHLRPTLPESRRYPRSLPPAFHFLLCTIVHYTIGTPPLTRPSPPSLPPLPPLAIMLPPFSARFLRAENDEQYYF